jgi:hypothetical protein
MVFKAQKIKCIYIEFVRSRVLTGVMIFVVVDGIGLSGFNMKYHNVMNCTKK